MKLIYYYDDHTDTLRRYPEDVQQGERWIKVVEQWIPDDQRQSDCRIEDVIDEANAGKLLKGK